MVSKRTKGVEVEVQTIFQDSAKSSIENQFLFTYKIRIRNMNPFPVQLLEREWNIFDAIGKNVEVKGDGVIGLQPTIFSGNFFEYVSNCIIHSEYGSMQGKYTFLNTETNEKFDVKIPVFKLEVPYILN